MKHGVICVYLPVRVYLLKHEEFSFSTPRLPG